MLHYAHKISNYSIHFINPPSCMHDHNYSLIIVIIAMYTKLTNCYHSILICFVRLLTFFSLTCHMTISINDDNEDDMLMLKMIKIH